MKRWALLSALVALVIPAAALAWGFSTFQVKPREFDPAKTFLVQSEWLTGIGCPTNAKTFDGTNTGGYTDPACTTGDPRGDRKNEGLLLAKTGPTSNFASAVADIKGVEGKTLTQLGYDIRKAGPTHLDARGSHCGAGAPRFNIDTTDDSYFLGCASPPPNQTVDGDGYLRLTWGGGTIKPFLAFSATSGLLVPVTGQVESLQIVFDEGYDTGPDNFGLAVLDNINVNGTRVGQGPGDGDDDHDNEHDDDGDRPRPCDRCNDDDDD
jgi:hypothetical protein